MAVLKRRLDVDPSGLTRRQQYDLLRTSLINERQSFDAHWRELADYFFPHRRRFATSERNRGERKTSSVIDSAPKFAAQTLQSGLHAGLTSPARPWMRLTTPDPDLAEFKTVKEWLHIVTQRMLTVFLRSNVYNALPILYGDMGVFGTGAIALLEDGKDLLRAYSYPLGSYAIGLDARGLATTWVRDYRMTVRQMVEEFGRVDGSRDIDWSRFSLDVKHFWDRSDYEQTFDICWMVLPNEEYDRSRLEARYTMPWKSCYFERGKGEGNKIDDGERGFLRESGFRHFPILVPRWGVTGEDTYATDCPGMTALGDTKQLQLMQKQKAKAIAKAIDPPMKATANLRGSKTSLLPGDVTYVTEGRDGTNGFAPVHEVRLEGLQYLVMDMAETRDRVRRAFYEDLFLMLAMSDSQRGSQPVTAREIEERHEEKLLALGPVLERTNDELLDPMIDRTFAIMLASGAIPAPPPELEGVDLKVEYLSIMSQAQKLVGVVGQDRFLQSTVSLVEAFPEIRHKIAIFQAVDRYQDMLGVDPELVRTDDEAQQLLDAERQAVAQAQQAEQAKALGTAAAALGKTPMGRGTALDAVIEGEAAA